MGDNGTCHAGQADDCENGRAIKGSGPSKAAPSLVHSAIFKDAPDFTARHQAWAYLNRVVEGPNAHLLALIWESGESDPISAAVRIIRRDPSLPSKVLSATESRCEWFQPLADLHSAASVGARFVTPDDDAWPGPILAESFHVSRIADGAKSHHDDAIPPHGLWVKGGNARVLTEKAITVVGTRAATRYGNAVAADIGAECATHGWTVVSGGAFGIDISAHRAALRVGHSTVAIVAHGIDVTYPAAHRTEFNALARDGAVITEYPPGTRPARHRFLTRNRLSAALGQGVVVIEAGYRSGALNTVSWAETMGKQVFAVPGAVTSRSSHGCHRLIREGRAELVESGADLIESLSPLGTVDSDAQLEMDYPATDVQRLDRPSLRVFDPVSGKRSDAAAIAASSGLPLIQTMTILCELRDKGLISRTGNLWQRDTAVSSV